MLCHSNGRNLPSVTVTKPHTPSRALGLPLLGEAIVTDRYDRHPIE